jgi:hypothetical protein
VLIRICGIDMFVREWLVELVEVDHSFCARFLRSFGIHLLLLLRILRAILLLKLETRGLRVMGGRFRDISVWISVD